MADGFVDFDWSTPLDLDERLRLSSEGPLVKGMFYTQIVEVARERGIDLGTPSYSAFRDYSMHDWLRLMARAATEAFPSVSESRGVCELGRPTYPRFRESLLGRVIFTVTDFDGALRLASKAYRRVGPATCELAEQSPGRAILQLRNVWEFPAWHIGVYEGAFEAFRLEGRVRMKTLSPCDHDLLLTWRV